MQRTLIIKGLDKSFDINQLKCLDRPNGKLNKQSVMIIIIIIITFSSVIQRLCQINKTRYGIDENQTKRLETCLRYLKTFNQLLKSSLFEIHH